MPSFFITIDKVFDTIDKIELKNYLTKILIINSYKNGLLR